MTTSTAPRRSTPTRIQRESDPINRIHFIGKNLTKVTAYRIVGPVTRYPLDEAPYPEHYTMRMLIYSKQGLTEWQPIVMYHAPHWKTCTGLHQFPNYAAEQLQRAIFGKVRDFIATEQPIVAKVVLHGEICRWQWRRPVCPFCHKTHFHGAGDQLEPALLGHRRAHCLDKDLAKLGITSRPGYLLEEAL